MIGIMADSHGQAEEIHRALEIFADAGCRTVYHLGDVCDSTRPATAEACLRLLQDWGVKAIKGNNDHTIVANYTGRKDSPIAPDVLQAYSRLDLAKYFQKAIFIHSLPFVAELGLSSMIGIFGPEEIRRFCRQYSEHILFRGHSHNPEVAWLQGGRVNVVPLSAGVRFDLSRCIPCAVTCGALTRGYCMLWDPGENFIECVSFR